MEVLKRVLFSKKWAFTGNFEVVFTAFKVFSIQKQPSGDVVKNCFSENLGKKFGKNDLFRKFTG